MNVDTLQNTYQSINQALDTVSSSDFGILTTGTFNTSSSSSKTGLIIAIIGLLIFSAHLFTSIFSKKRIPDVLFLIVIGLVIGPITHWVNPDSLGVVGGIFSAITLVIILFQSGTQLTFSTLKNSVGAAARLTLMNFVFTTVAIWLLGWLLFNVNSIVSLTLGLILGGTASAVVIPIVQQLNMTDKSRTILILEAAIGNVLSIVLAIALLHALRIGQVEFGLIFGQVFSSFILATFMGFIGAIFWAFILDKVRNIKYSLLTTPAFVFIIYGVNEWMGYSGAIAALAFGVGLANIDDIYDGLLKKYIKRQPANLTDSEMSLFSEIALLLKTFFFIYVGISIELTAWLPLLIGLGISILMFIIRIPVVRIAISSKKDEIPYTDMMYMSSLNPKGLTAAVLATSVAETMPDGTLIKNFVFSVILFSIVITSVLIPIVNKSERLRRLYKKLIGDKESEEKILSENVAG